MICTIEWNTYTRVQWSELLSRCPHSTILQSYYYAQTMREVHKQGVRHGLIKIDNVEAGIVQMHEVSLFGKLIHAISLDRGPLWFDGFGKDKHLMAFAKTIDTQFPARFGRKRRMIFEHSTKNTSISFNNIQKNQKTSPYKTFSINISQKKEEIRDNFNKKWRYSLSKSEKEPINIIIDENLSTLSRFLKQYMHDRITKGYPGASAKFLATLAKYGAMGKECFIANAIEDNEIIASALIFIHGKTATYQSGWITPYGRDKNANHLLFWYVIQLLKKRGITQLDLGGHNDQTEGLYRFKKGFGGQETTLIGSYS